jgi:hypothetical protein
MVQIVAYYKTSEERRKNVTKQQWLVIDRWQTLSSSFCDILCKGTDEETRRKMAREWEAVSERASRILGGKPYTRMGWQLDDGTLKAPYIPTAQDHSNYDFVGKFDSVLSEEEYSAWRQLDEYRAVQAQNEDDYYKSLPAVMAVFKKNYPEHYQLIELAMKLGCGVSKELS